MGDLLVLMPIAETWWEHNCGNRRKYDLLVTGPCSPEYIRKIISLRKDHLSLNEVYVHNHHHSGREDVTKHEIEWWFRRKISYSDKPVLSLNHIKDGQIRTADEVAKECLGDIPANYERFKYRSERIQHFPFKRESFIVVGLTGDSNQNWFTKYNLRVWKNAIEHIVMETGFPVLLVGKTKPTTAFEWAFPNKLGIAKKYRGALIPYYNTTTLAQVNWLMNNSYCNMFFDNGLKNLGFLSRRPTIYYHDSRWHAANPVGAWAPKQLFGSKNFLVSNKFKNGRYAIIDMKQTINEVVDKWMPL